MVKIQLEIENVLTCPLCGGSDIPQLYTRQHGSLKANYSFCKSCGFSFLNPRMTDAFTEKYYQDYYRQVTLQTEERIQRDLVVQRQRAEIQSLVLRNNDVIGHKNIQSHLDIGCSAGYLLEAMLADYSVGVDYDEYEDILGETKVDLPKNNYTVYKQLEDVPSHPFHLITMSHSLEHINHPVEYLQHLQKKYANEHTVYMIEVPDALHNQDAFLIHHPCAFNQKTLTMLFNKIGYKPVELVNHGLGAPLPLYLIGIFVKSELK